MVSILQKTVLGIDIGSFSIKIVEITQNGGKSEIINYAIAKTPENSVNDGKIMDVDKVASVIEGLLLKNFSKTKRVISVISSSALLTREVNIPKMNESDIEKYISLDSQQYFPVNLDDYILDFKVLEEVSGVKGPELMVFLVAVPQNIVNDYMKLFNKLKLDIEAIDIAPNALSKLAKAISVNKITSKKEDNMTTAVIDLGAETTTVTIVENGVLQFSRSIPSGGNGLTQSIANTFGLNMQEAEEYKLKNSEIVLETHDSTNLSSSISDTIKPMLDSLASYINKFFEFYCTRNTLNKIDSIYLTGGGSLLKGIEEYYRGLFNMPTKRINIADGIVDKSNKPTVQKDLPIILNAFAATYRD